MNVQEYAVSNSQISEPINERRHVVMFSGGIGSWATAKRVAAQHGTENLLLLFADTLVEDDDLYRFLIEATANIYGLDLSLVWQQIIERTTQPIAAWRLRGLPCLAIEPGLITLPPLQMESERRSSLEVLAQATMQVLPGLRWISDGRNIWEVFFQHSLIGNTRNDPCSDELKRQICRAWIRAEFCDGIADMSLALKQGCSRSEKIKAFLLEQEQAAAAKATFYLGYDWSEIHRWEKALSHWQPWTMLSPLCDAPLIHKSQWFEVLKTSGIQLPRLYTLNMPHNNCFGACVKAGQAQWLMVLDLLPQVFAYHEQKETQFRAEKGKDVSILRDYRGGEFKPLPLSVLRSRWESLTQKQRNKIRRAWAKPEQLSLLTADGLDLLDWGGCGCFAA